MLTVWGVDDVDYVNVVDCDVVEMPRLSQQVRLEKEQATDSFHVMDSWGNERGIFYNVDVAVRFCDRYGFSHIEPRPILGESGYRSSSFGCTGDEPYCCLGR